MIKIIVTRRAGGRAPCNPGRGGGSLMLKSLMLDVKKIS